MDFILATHNQHKVLEFERILKPYGIHVLSQTESGINAEAEENADTFEGNAFLKAKAVFDLAHQPVLADDSGLMVDALNGAPGVYSARYGGSGLTDEDRTALLLKNMQEIEDPKRSAAFVCAICLLMPSGKHYTFTGKCDGKIGWKPRGNNGFGYDPVFMVGSNSFSELSSDQKDEVSHRGKALRKLASHIEDILKDEGEI